jgi:hypothetical protein
MNVHDEVERQLFEYAIANDTKDWPRLAALFTHGKFFFAATAGPDGVLDWAERTIREEVPTQHLFSTLTVEPDPKRPGVVHGRNYLTLSAQDAELRVHVISACWFENTWELLDGALRWRTHVVKPIFRGDTSLIHKTPHTHFGDADRQS